MAPSTPMIGRPSPRSRALRTLGVAIALLAIVAGCGDGQEAGRRGPRLVILGFDGVDPRLLSRWMEEGKLPRLRALAERGDYRPLASTNPPQSPVAWTTFATGTGPARHGIFDFIERNPATYLPDVGTGGVRPPRYWHGVVQSAPARGYTRRRGVPFWEVAAEHGVHAVVLRGPYASPPDRGPGGRMPSGLGAPDLPGTNSPSSTWRATWPPTGRAIPAAGGWWGSG